MESHSRNDGNGDSDWILRHFKKSIESILDTVGLIDLSLVEKVKIALQVEVKMQFYITFCNCSTYLIIMCYICDWFICIKLAICLSI